MKIKFKGIFLILLFFAAAASASAVEIKSEISGLLSKKISNPSEVSELSVSGVIDAEDLYFIGKELVNLTTLDLSEAEIVETKNVRINGSHSYAANTIPAGAFSGLPLKTVVFPTQPDLRIESGAFLGTELEEISFPGNVVYVGAGAFASSALKTVTLPGEKCTMGENVFSDCKNLEKVNVGTASEIAAGTFRNCPQIAVVEGSENLVAIGDCAFEGAVSLTEFDFGKNLATLGERSFAGTGLKEANLENTKLTKVDPLVFAHTKVEKVLLPEDIAEIGQGAFFGAASLTGVELPDNVSVIGDHSFVGGNLTSLGLSSGLEEIGAYALKDQKQVKELILPASLKYIGDYAMEGMTGLETIHGEALTSVPELGEKVWEGVDQSEVKLYVQNDFAGDFETTPQWEDFNIIFTDGVNDVTDDSLQHQIRGRFVGTQLQIESKAQDIEEVNLFDVSGRLLASSKPAQKFVTMETAPFPGGVFVITVTLSDKVSATLKLARR